MPISFVGIGGPLGRCCHRRSRRPSPAQAGRRPSFAHFARLPPPRPLRQWSNFGHPQIPRRPHIRPSGRTQWPTRGTPRMPQWRARSPDCDAAAWYARSWGTVPEPAWMRYRSGSCDACSWCADDLGPTAGNLPRRGKPAGCRPCAADCDGPLRDPHRTFRRASRDDPPAGFETYPLRTGIRVPALPFQPVRSAAVLLDAAHGGVFRR